MSGISLISDTLEFNSEPSGHCNTTTWPTQDKMMIRCQTSSLLVSKQITAIFYFSELAMNQRYWTAGFEVASEKLSWQVASYGEEIGTTVAGVTTAREDRQL
jgi:hypothetical protein